MTALVARIAPSLLALAIALVVSAIIIALAGSNPALAFAALSRGAFGSLDGWSEVCVKACPLLVTGLAVGLAFRSGIWNIGAEGQLLLGAIAMAWLGPRDWPVPGWLALPLAFGVAGVAGAAWAGIAGILKTRRNVNEVISTIMLNFVALGLVSYLVHGPLMEAARQYPQTDAVAAALRLPRFFPPYRLHAGVFVAMAAAAGIYVLLFRTVLGYQLRAVGLNVAAARLSGIRSNLCMLVALMLSGALAGLAGAIEVSALTYRLYEKFSPGYGFTAIAVALLGRLHPAGIVVAALFFGALDAGSKSMESAAGVSSVLVSVMQAVVIFSLIAVEHRTWFPSTTGAPAS